MYEQQDLKLVGSRIKAVRISRGMSQADLAVEASVSLPLISNIERGKTGMQLETFVKVAEALQVSADYLLRPDVPEVKAIYQGEFAELLEDCSASEMETILKIVREVKASMHMLVAYNRKCKYTLRMTKLHSGKVAAEDDFVEENEEPLADDPVLEE